MAFMVGVAAAADGWTSLQYSGRWISGHGTSSGYFREISAASAKPTSLPGNLTAANQVGSYMNPNGKFTNTFLRYGKGCNGYMPSGDFACAGKVMLSFGVEGCTPASPGPAGSSSCTNKYSGVNVSLAIAATTRPMDQFSLDDSKVCGAMDPNGVFGKPAGQWNADDASCCAPWFARAADYRASLKAPFPYPNNAGAECNFAPFPASQTVVAISSPGTYSVDVTAILKGAGPNGAFPCDPTLQLIPKTTRNLDPSKGYDIAIQLTNVGVHCAA